MDFLAIASPFAKTGEGFRAGFYIFISLFAIVSITHLVFCFLMKPFWRKLTKPFCLVLLGAAMAFLVPDYPMVYVSCWISAVGDLLLIRNREAKFFVTGAVVFAAAHTLNAIVQVGLLKGFSIPNYVWAIFAAVVVIAGVAGYFCSDKKQIAIGIVSPAYACFHFVNIAFAVMLLVDGLSAFKLLILFGYLAYVVSDLIVNYVTNKRDINRRDFYIMLTYLAGQVMIYFGLAYSLIG